MVEVAKSIRELALHGPMLGIGIKALRGSTDNFLMVKHVNTAYGTGHLSVL